MREGKGLNKWAKTPLGISLTSAEAEEFNKLCWRVFQRGIFADKERFGDNDNVIYPAQNCTAAEHTEMRVFCAGWREGYRPYIRPSGAHYGPDEILEAVSGQGGLIIHNGQRVKAAAQFFRDGEPEKGVDKLNSLADTLEAEVRSLRTLIVEIKHSG